MQYNSERVLTAWKAFVGKGFLMEDHLRPEVARSWIRCRQMGADPWSTDFPRPLIEEYKKKREDNRLFLQKAHPVLEYLSSIFNSNVSFCDYEGFIFEFISPLDNYPRTVGTYMDEGITGSGAITISFKEKIPYRTDGFEHYRIVSQGYSNVSSPVFVNEKFIGVLSITNPFSSLPDSALDCCIEAANIISLLLNGRNQERTLFSTANIFETLLNGSDEGIIVLDEEGRILLANKTGRDIIPDFNEIGYGERSFGDYLTNKDDLGFLIDNNLELDKEKLLQFKKVSGVQEVTLPIVMRRHISLPNGLKHILLSFEMKIKEKEKENKPILRNEEQNIDYIGKSKAWKEVDLKVRKVAKFDVNVLLLGETGTGKEVVARAIHRRSGRTGKFIAVNCGAIPKDLLSSELFGYEGGAFTGAKASGSIGKFEYAQGGTLFLDEIGEMPLDMQVALLRVLQDRAITRVGSNKSIPIDVRIIAATNRDIPQMVKEGTFRADLYYRLSIIDIRLPLLKERDCDIALLAEYFNGILSEQLRITHQLLSEELTNALMNYDWPGNVRELRNVVEKMLILSEGEPITIDLLPDYIKNEIHVKEKRTFCNDRENPISERDAICLALEKWGGNILKAAKDLGMARNTLYRKIEKYHIELKTFAIKNE